MTDDGGCNLKNAEVLSTPTCKEIQINIKINIGINILLIVKLV